MLLVRCAVWLRCGAGYPPHYVKLDSIFPASPVLARLVRAAVGADAGQVEGLRAFLGLRCRVMLKEHDGGSVPAGELGLDMRGEFSDRGRGAGLGNDGQVAGLSSRGQPYAQVSNTLPGRGGAQRVAPERLVGDQLPDRQALR
jgi:hypothetical protein